MDQTDFAVHVGLLFGFPIGGVLLHKVTGWSLWVSLPVGGLAGLLLIAIATFLLIEFLARRRDRKES